MENENLEHSHGKYYKMGIIFIILGVITIIVGSSFAWGSWRISENQQTAVTFTTTEAFTCSADGGGNISPGDIKLAPASCTDENYAIKRTVTVSPTFNMDGKLFMDLWLKVNSIGSGLSASQNFKYALTTSSSSCTTGVVSEGNFNGATTNSKVPLLNNKIYSQTTNETYYLWIWLDEAETNINTANQSFSMELGGACTNQPPGQQTYTANINDYYINIGNPINPYTITQYNTPAEAITALETAYSQLNSGAIASLPFFLMHTITDFKYTKSESESWCLIESGGLTGYGCVQTRNECIQIIEDYYGYTEEDEYVFCANNAVTESYVGFVVTEDMVYSNPDMTPGIYYLKGGDGGTAYNDNITTLTTAFGSNNCYDNSNYFSCGEGGLAVELYTDGEVDVYSTTYMDNYCIVYSGGDSSCYVNPGA